MRYSYNVNYVKNIIRKNAGEDGSYELPIQNERGKGHRVIVNLLLKGMDYYGFDLLLYGFSRFTTGTGVGDPNDFLILGNHQIDYLEGCVDTEHLMNAPMVKWAN